MNPARRDVLRTFGVALLLLPLCLAAWYFARDAINWLPTRLAAPVIGAAAGPVQKIEKTARGVGYVIEVEGRYRPGGTPRAEAKVDVPTSNYTFGVAIFTALTLAVRGWRRAWHFALGVAILLVIPVFGIAFEALRNLGTAPELAGLLTWGGGKREAIALGYQVGSLLLPTLGPIVVWLSLYPEVLRPNEWGRVRKLT
jgi:hypothetical protein